MDSFKPNPEILEKLRVELKDDLVNRLVAYCHAKAKRRPWYGLLLTSEASMAEGHLPEDIVQTAITKTLDAAMRGPGKNRRVWDGIRDLYDHLTSQIDSELSNLGNGWVNRKFRRATQMAEVEDGAYFDGVKDSTATSSPPGPTSTMIWKASSTETPETIVLDRQVEARADEFVCGLIDFLGEDDFLIRIVQEVLDGARKPAEIAKALDVKADAIYKARKRLQRRLEEYQTVLSDKEEVRHG